MSGAEEAIAAFVAARLNEAEAAAHASGSACIAWLTYRDDTGGMLYATVAARHGDWEPWVADGKDLPEPASARVVYDPARVLAEIGHTRALIVRIRATPHQDTDDPYYACPQALLAKDWTFDGGDSACNCGRDARVMGMLWVIASRWDGRLDFKPEWKP